ncbi:MAG: site-2 protease family protein [Chloroflexota bacterium]
MLDELFIVKLLLIGIILLVALPIHEFAHALTAYRFGDGTAKLLGRLTLNPIVHFDPVGGTLLVLTLLAPGGLFVFGWAKPTPVNPANLRGGRGSDAWVALAGPLSNLIMATAVAIPFRVMLATGVDVPVIVLVGMDLFIRINIALMIFNLIPLPPLDGSHVLLALVDPRTSWRLRNILQQYGPILLLALILVPSLTGLPSPLGIIFEVIAGPIITLLTGQ